MRKSISHILLFLFFSVFAGCSNNTESSSETADSSSIKSVDENKTSTDEEVSFSPNEEGTSGKENVYKSLMAFQIKDTMEVNNTEKATLLLSKNETIEAVMHELISSTGDKESNMFVDTSLEIAQTMRATLKDVSPDKKNFRIELVGEGTELQDIDSISGNQAFWQWNVTPLREGQHKLDLIIEVVLSKNKKKFLPSKTIALIIHSEPESFGSRMSTFFGNNWQWLIGALMVPIFIAWMNLKFHGKLKKPVGRRKIR